MTIGPKHSTTCTGTNRKLGVIAKVAETYLTAVKLRSAFAPSEK
jgi:hypothetical protein